MEWLYILTGVALLISGRQVFWLLVAGLGVVTGLTLVEPLLGDAEPVVVLAIALCAGIVGALLAVFVQKLAVGIAGFLAGGYLAVLVAPYFGLQGGLELVVWLGGGVLGSLLLAIFFEYALIALSALAGAALIVQYSGLSPDIHMITTLVLAMIGITVQTNAWPAKPRKHRHA